MAYFSNGTEGMMYEEKYCSKCVHDRPDEDNFNLQGCKVWDLHFEYNYDQNRKTARGKAIRDVLSALIPNEKDSHWPDECSMFLSLDELLDEALERQKEREYVKKLREAEGPVYGVPV